MAPRFYAPDLRPDFGLVQLPEEEAAHLTRVMRLRPGDTVRVFDGRGLEAEARVATLRRGAVLVEPVRLVDAAAEPAVSLTLAQAVLASDKFDQVVRDAVMLGVSAIQPVLSERTDVPPRAFAGRTRIERWRRIAIASSKQCGRAVVPEIRSALPLRQVTEQDRSELRIMFVEPAASAAVSDLNAVRRRRVPASALVIVGPEGGWTPEEVSTAAGLGCMIVTMGKRTLRADAAPLVGISVLQSIWGDL